MRVTKILAECEVLLLSFRALARRPERHVTHATQSAFGSYAASAIGVWHFGSLTASRLRIRYDQHSKAYRLRQANLLSSGASTPRSLCTCLKLKTASCLLAQHPPSAAGPLGFSFVDGLRLKDYHTTATHNHYPLFAHGSLAGITCLRVGTKTQTSTSLVPSGCTSRGSWVGENQVTRPDYPRRGALRRTAVHSKRFGTALAGSSNKAPYGFGGAT